MPIPFKKSNADSKSLRRHHFISCFPTLYIILLVKVYQFPTTWERTSKQRRENHQSIMIFSQCLYISLYIKMYDLATGVLCLFSQMQLETRCQATINKQYQVLTHLFKTLRSLPLTIIFNSFFMSFCVVSYTKLRS